MPDLFPVFEFSERMEEKYTNEAKQHSSLYFDFEKGDFKKDKNGRIETAQPYDAWVQWCLKTVYTQRQAYLGYSGAVGTELEQAFKSSDKEQKESYIEYTITQALLADPYKRTKRVYDFKFEWKTDSVKITFTISGVWNDDYKAAVNLQL